MKLIKALLFPKVRLAATAEERRRVYAFRYKIYIEEMKKTSAEADHKNKLLKDDLDEVADLLYLEKNGEVAATLRINLLSTLPRLEDYAEAFGINLFKGLELNQIGYVSRLMVAKRWRSSLVMPSLLEAVFRQAKKLGCAVSLIHCVPSLTRLYERIGYRKYKNGFEMKGLGTQIPLLMVGDDLDYFKTVRSPFYGPAKELFRDEHMKTWFERTFPERHRDPSIGLLSVDDFWSYFSEHLRPEDIPLFKDLNHEEMKSFIGVGTTYKGNTGEVLLRQDDWGNEMCLVLNGRLTATRQTGKKRAQLAEFLNGDLFGEVALLSTAPRTATITAETDFEVLVISQTFLRKAMKRYPEISLKVLFNLSCLLSIRLKDTTDLLMGHSDSTT